MVEVAFSWQSTHLSPKRAVTWSKFYLVYLVIPDFHICSHRSTNASTAIPRHECQIPLPSPS